jgi:hypothetical protein
MKWFLHLAARVQDGKQYEPSEKSYSVGNPDSPPERASCLPELRHVSLLLPPVVVLSPLVFVVGRAFAGFHSAEHITTTAG